MKHKSKLDQSSNKITNEKTHAQVFQGEVIQQMLAYQDRPFNKDKANRNPVYKDQSIAP